MFLITKRLRLRDVIFDDWSFVFNYFKDERFYRYRAVPIPDENYVQSEIQKYLEQQQENPRRFFNLLIEELESAQKIGLVSLRPPEAAGYEAEIGYSIHHDFLGRGFATEAAQAVIDFGREKLGISRFVAHVNVENRASHRVLEKIGFQCEGKLEKPYQTRGITSFANRYSLLS